MVAVNIYTAAGLPYWKQYWQELGGGDVIFAQDTRREAIRGLNIRTAGATVIIDRKGHIVFRDLSATEYDDLKEGVEKAL